MLLVYVRHFLAFELYPFSESRFIHCHVPIVDNLNNGLSYRLLYLFYLSYYKRLLTQLNPASGKVIVSKILQIALIFLTLQRQSACCKNIISILTALTLNLFEFFK